ncbi:MAG: hypothetical protein HC881_06210 [Leptolyngbyaceae cyanobacterium SL_7_1]|nr:hypothetical protein [Leptolyngbyaceae cyanobacterium SL_7_1]
MATQFHHDLSEPVDPPERIIKPTLSDLVVYPDQASVQGGRFPLLQPFYDLPIQQKQRIGVLASGLASAVGLAGLGVLVTVANGRSQLLDQAESELAVLKTQYDAKLNQMASSGQRQASNSTIVQAASNYASDLALPETDQVREFLQTQVTSLDLEYATLVGKDMRIIASANSDRRGEQFDPDGLVGTILANPRQVKTNSVVVAAELQREAPVLPSDSFGQDALVRYALTPVINPETGETVGVLVLGDVVDRESAIIKDSLASLNDGYGAAYARSQGNYLLASSLNLGNARNTQAGVNVPVPDPAILEWASTAQGKPVAKRMQVGDQRYGVAAQAVLNFRNEPIGVLVRGTPEVALNSLLQRSLLLHWGQSAWQA